MEVVGEFPHALGTDGRTGGGGANAVTRSNLWENFKAARKAAAAMGNKEPEWPLGHEFPADVDLRVAIRRTLRVEGRPGRELEDVGVERDLGHDMTLHDVLYGNQGLLTKAATCLDEMRAEQQRGNLKESGRLDKGRGSMFIDIEMSGVDRLDWFIDGNKGAPHDAKLNGSTFTFELRPGEHAKLLELRGYRDGGEAPVATRKIRLRPAELT